MTAPPNDKRSLLYGGSFAIMDPETLGSLSQVVNIDAETFCKRYKEWIKSTELNTITGIEHFPYTVFSNGTTEAFDKFYIKNNKKRFRCFKGEYIYHQVTWRNSWPNWKFIEDAPLETNDAVIISLPFSDTGNEHTKMKETLHICTELKIPVLVDCVYFGVCSDIDFNFNFDCITDITFSLSKAFPLAYARVGMRLTREDNDDSLLMLHKIDYTNRVGAGLGYKMIERFSPDFIVQRYKNHQIELCKTLGIKPSNTVLFGIDEHNRYPEYNRGGATNRLGLHKYYV
jgi:hypothetical protein